jgi:hypothetical protein
MHICVCTHVRQPPFTNGQHSTTTRETAPQSAAQQQGALPPPPPHPPKTTQNTHAASFPRSAFFDEKGLVRQQLDSFNEFVTNTVQEIVDEAPEIVVRPNEQHLGGPVGDGAEVRCVCDVVMW